MTKITFLGTSSMQPSKERNHPSILLTYNSENILFDCGEGTQRQMRIAGIKPSKITKICISHWHGDHVLGLPGLMSTMGTDQYAKKVQIFGPKGTKKYIEHMLKAFFSKDVIEFEIKEVEEGIVFENKDFILESYKLEHGAPCAGYSFIEKDKLRINLSKANKLGLKEGPELGKLQEGKDITFKGKKISYKDVTYKVYGKKVSYIADTINCDGANKLAENSDLMISESSFHSKEQHKAEEYLHLTAKDAALIASQNGVKKLVLTHPSLRYKDVNILVDEAKDYFQETIFAHDFMKINL